MKKIILFIIILNTFICNNNPKVAVVLSGGGAKGTFHIPTLEILDSLNIPIDYVIGTSIGSIAGALYSIGYSPSEIKSIAFNTDWDLIMFDKKIRKKLSYFQKNDYHKYQLHFTLNNFKPQVPIAFNSGHESYLYLSKLTRHNEMINEFDNYVIPFRCNANDLLSGEEIIFTEGSLSKALRCSSSIPSIFSPVKDNNYLLVDGGVLNNLGTDIAYKLGADIIIAVDASPDIKKNEDIIDIFDVLSRSIQLNAMKRKKENLELSTVLISPNTNYKTLNFEKSTMTEIYKSGYKSVYKQIDSLIEIKNSLSRNREKNSYIKLSSINSDSIYIKSVTINSKSIIKINELINYNMPAILTKNQLIDIFFKLRKSNLYNNIHYYFKNEIDGYILIINLEKNTFPLINNVLIDGNDKTSSELLNEIIDIHPGEVLDYDKIDAKINQLYSLDFFESIRYELINLNNNSIDLKFGLKESDFKRLKIGASWSNYYQLIGKIKVDLINKPASRFRLQNKLLVGNSMKENHFSLLYTGQYSKNLIIIPKISIINKKNKVSYYNDTDLIINSTINERLNNIGLLFPISSLGYLELGFNKQLINYSDNLSEKFNFYNFSIEIDQMDDVLYPTDGIRVKYYKEKSQKNNSYISNKINLDFYKMISKRNCIRIFSNYYDSNNLDSIYKNINYFKSDQMPGNSEYNIFSSNLFSYGFEYNYLYKSSQRFRLLINILDNVTLKNNNLNKENIASYGFGLRIKSIFGPINLLWVTSDKKLVENSKLENYYFSIGIDY